MPIYILAAKEFKLLLRDRRAALLLLAMPILFIFILGLLLGENFGQKPDDRTVVPVVDLDTGPGLFADEPWSRVILRDLRETAGIRVELIATLAQAEELIAEHRRPGILVLEPHFSARINQCSFLREGINPFYRDGVNLDQVGARMLEDRKQPSGAAIINQVAQVTLLRVILPYMIGKAFEKLSDPSFIELLGTEVNLPVPGAWRLIVRRERMTLKELLALASGKDEALAQEFKQKVGGGVQNALRQQFDKYDLTGKTWDTLTKSLDQRQGTGGAVTTFVNQDGSGFMRRGAARYQILVPSYTVMFSFFLVLTVGSLFVSEKRQGTLKRLRAAPLTGYQILLGKLLPCLAVSLGQGLFLLSAGKLVFGMHWGPADWPLLLQCAWMLAVAASTSLAAMGLALLVAALARTEMQVALYGVIVVLVLALIGGCVLPREMMPEQTQVLTLVTPHGWALDAYRELLDPDPRAVPNLGIVARGCGVLILFGTGFMAVAWSCMKLE